LFQEHGGILGVYGREHDGCGPNGKHPDQNLEFFHLGDCAEPPWIGEAPSLGIKA